MLGNWESACDDFSKALAVNPTNNHFRFNHAFALRKLERFDIAVEDYQLTRALKNDDFRGYFEKTGVHVRNTLQYRKMLGDEAIKHVAPGPTNPLNMKARRLSIVEGQVREGSGVHSMTREQQNEELRYILDKLPHQRTGDELGFIKSVLEQRHILKHLDISALTLLEILRTMSIGKEDPRSYLYHQTQINEKLYILLDGKVTLLKDPPNTSVSDDKMEQDAVFGNVMIENMCAPEAVETALVEENSEFIVVSSKSVKDSIKSYHADTIAENIRFLSSSMLFRHWRKAQLHELASHFVIKTYDGNATIVTQGDKVKGFWMMKSGQSSLARTLQYTQHDEASGQHADAEVSVTLRDLWRRDWFGEDCILEATEGAEYRESVICSTPVEVIFLHAEDCVKLVAPNKVTVDLLRQAASPPPPDYELLDAYFANASWANFKEQLQVSAQATSIDNINVLDKFPVLPKQPKIIEKPHRTKLHTFMKDHREFLTIQRS